MKISSRTFHLGIIFWIGFAALIYQIYSVRVLFMFFVESTHAVAVAVSSFLAGLAFSSLLFSRLTHHNTRNRLLICLMTLAAGLYGYVLLTHYQWIPEWSDAIRHAIATEWIAGILKYTIVWLYLFFPAFFLGGAFPLVNGLYLNSLKESSRDTGIVYFWDTLGAIAGALFAGFVLLPCLGLRLTACVAAGINLLVAITLAPRRYYALALALCLALAVAFETHTYMNGPEPYFKITDAGHMIPVASVPHSVTLSPVPANVPGGPQEASLNSRYGTVLFQKESPYGRITVGKTGDKKTLFINHRDMCASDSVSERELANSAMLERKPGSDVLNIGLGCGLTASRLAFNAKTKKLDIAEINPVIPEATRMFAVENQNVLDASNVSLHIMDGAEWLRNVTGTYDAIVVDVEEITIIYSSPLFTEEYFAIIRNRLNPDGVFALWSFAVSPEFTRVMYNTLKAVFPYVTIQYFNDNAVNYYAAMQPLTVTPGPGVDKAKTFGAQVMAFDNNGINTLETRTLEKYYNSNSNFGLPDYYREKFISQY